MANNFFLFKSFSIRQETAAMKVGTDGVLIGAWARVRAEQKRFLDIGAGTGLIGLMLAQRTQEWSASVDAVEIETEGFRQALENINASPWAERISIYCNSIQDFARWRIKQLEPLYDHIVSNPPYFVNSLTPPEQSRALARHTSALTHRSLCESVAALLAPSGAFSVIIPWESYAGFIETAADAGLFPSRRCTVYTLEGMPPKRVMLEFLRNKIEGENSEICIESGSPRDFSPEYRALTQDFYLKF